MEYTMNLLQYELYGNTIQVYLVSVVIVAATFLVALLIDRHLKDRLFRWAEASETPVDNFIMTRIFPPIIYLLILLGLYLAKNQVQFSDTLGYWVDRILLAGGLAILFILIIRFMRGIIEAMASSYSQRLEKEAPEDLDRQKRMVERIRKQVVEVTNMVLIVLAILTILSNMGVDLKAIWASLGIGGIALALAVKEPLTNLVGRMYIYGTGIFDVGHFIVFGQYSGTVTNISVFRTYMLIFADMTVVSIPNADFIKGVVKNYFGRTKFMYKWDLDVKYSVPAETVQELIRRLRELVQAKPEVNQDSCWIYLDRLDSYAKVVRVWFQAGLPDWASSMYFGDRTLHEIQLLFEEMGLDFAFPTQTVELEGNVPRPRPREMDAK